MEESFVDENVILSGGPCVPKYEGPIPWWLEYFWDETGYGKTNTFLSLIDLGERRKNIPPTYIYGCNFAIRKNVLLKLFGTFPDYYAEKYKQYQGDGESGLALKIQKCGFNAHYNPQSMIHHLIPSSRLTIDYFIWRRYYNGIHASFRDYRNYHGLDSVNMFIKQNTQIHRIIFSTRRPLELARYFFFRMKNIIQSKPARVKEIRNRIEKSFHEGYNYHRKELEIDPKLREWVLRPNFLGANGKLPIP